MNAASANRNKHIKPKVVFGTSPPPPSKSPIKQEAFQQKKSKCCRRLRFMGLWSSTLPQIEAPPASMSELHEQVAGLERELQWQREVDAIYRARLEKLQDYLRYCLQIAQENGFLDLIKKNQQDSPLSSNFNPMTSFAQPSTMPSDVHLLEIRDQARLNGWYIEPHEIELKEQIGKGSTATIYRGTWRGLDVAVKCICPEVFHSNESGVVWFAQELETQSRQRHPFVLQLMGACLNPPEKGWVVTEFLSGRTLKEWLHGQKGRQKERLVPLPPLEDRIRKGMEIAQAMQYLHEQKPKVIHRDLKPSNIFLDDAMHVRVADFGHARFLLDGEQALTGETGTFVYMAPEVIRSEPYNEKCDVYSFGVILNELITGEHPYIESSYGPTKIALEVGEGRLRPTLPQEDGQLRDLIDLTCHSWDGDASKRPSFTIITRVLRKIQEKLIKHVEI